MENNNKEKIYSKKPSNPLVTVVITVYNNPIKELDECIKSIVNQSYSPIETLLVDDGSNNQYKLKLKKILLSYPQLRYLKKQNGGISSARNFGIINSKSEFICFIDPDDTYHKDKILIQTNILLKKQNISVIAGGSVTNSYKNELLNSEIRMPSMINGNCFPLILNGFLEIHGTPNYLFRKSAIINAGLFNEDLILNEDRDLLYRISKKHNFITHKDIVCFVNKTERSTTSNLNRIKLESKLKFLNKVVDDEDILDLNVKANYAYKSMILNLILSSDYAEFDKYSPKFNIKLIANQGLKLTFRTLILKLVSNFGGCIIYWMYRKRFNKLIRKINLT